MLCRRLYSHIGYIGQKFRYKPRVLPRCSAREFHVVLRAALAVRNGFDDKTRHACVFTRKQNARAFHFAHGRAVGFSQRAFFVAFRNKFIRRRAYNFG